MDTARVAMATCLRPAPSRLPVFRTVCSRSGVATMSRRVHCLLDCLLYLRKRCARCPLSALRYSSLSEAVRRPFSAAAIVGTGPRRSPVLRTGVSRAAHTVLARLSPVDVLITPGS